MSWVWKHSRERGTALLAELALADWADDDGYTTYAPRGPMMPHLTRKVRCDARQARRLVNHLERVGAIERVEVGRGRGNRAQWRIVMDMEKRTQVSGFSGMEKRTSATEKGTSVTGFSEGENRTSVTVKPDIHDRKTGHRRPVSAIVSDCIDGMTVRDDGAGTRAERATLDGGGERKRSSARRQLGGGRDGSKVGDGAGAGGVHPVAAAGRSAFDLGEDVVDASR